MTTEDRKEAEPAEKVVSLGHFFESVPPSTAATVAIEVKRSGATPRETMVFLEVPEIRLHCRTTTCDGERVFRYTGRNTYYLKEHLTFDYHITYTCSNCQEWRKTYSFAITPSKGFETARCYKFGERPPFGPYTPSRLISLIGPDRELFLKGRRCESQGLGLGAFAYYRQVVERQKDRILDEVISVSKRVGVSSENLGSLEAAKAETQFQKAIGLVSDALPSSLLIDGRNPLTLLHSALSDGLHNRDDAHCLELATSIRVVLAELAERMALALKDDAELKDAIFRLAKLTAKRNSD